MSKFLDSVGNKSAIAESLFALDRSFFGAADVTENISLSKISRAFSFGKIQLCSLVLLVGLAFSPLADAQTLTENFDDITTLGGKGWNLQNASVAVGTTNWFQGSNVGAGGPFDAQAGAPNSYIGANYNNTGSVGTINNWLETPAMTLNNGDVLTFYTRKPSPDSYADRLELRLSTNGASTSVTGGSAGVGDFTTLLLSINPSLALGVYPTTWTQYTVTISGLSDPIQGRLAFRYFVTSAGLSGTNSDYIGIDTVSYLGTQYWNGTTVAADGAVHGGSGTWNNSLTNWTGITGAAAGSWANWQAIFQGTPGTVDVTEAVNFKSLSFTSNYTLQGAGSLNMIGDGTMTVNAGTQATINTIILGAGSLTKTGSGTLVLGGNNSYSGGTLINGGVVSVSADNNLGASSGNVTLNGGTLQSTASFTTERNTILNVGGGTFNTDNTTTLTHNGVISGAGGLTKTGSGSLVLGGSNTYLGGTSINGGVVKVSADSNLGYATGGLSFGSGTLQTTASLTTTRGTILNVGGGTFNADDTTTLTHNGIISGAGGLTKTGSGSLVLGGSNTYLGGTSINSGVVKVSADNNLGDANGGLSLGGGRLQTTASFTTARGTTLNVDGGTFDTDGATTLTHNGIITGAGSLTKVGDGSLVLGGSNTYLGGTSINGGLVQVSTDVNLGAASRALALNGGTLQTTGTFATVRATTLDAGGGTFNTDGATTLTHNGNISGTGALVKTGSGILALGGNNTYNGTTAVNQGTLSIISDSNLGIGGLTLDGGALQVTSATAINHAIKLEAGGGEVTVDSAVNLAGVISGAGKLTKSGSGDLTLTATNIYTGDTILNAGRLIVNGSLASTIVQVNSGAILGGSGNIAGNVTINNGGTLSPGNSPGIITLGSLTLNPGATTIFEINGKTAGSQHDQVVVVGNAALGGTAKLDFGGAYVPTDGDTLTLIQAGSVTGEFASLVSNLGAVFKLETVYSPSTFELKISISQQNYVNFAGNANQFAVANTLDSFSRSGQMPVLIGILNQLNAAQLSNAFQQMSPESLGAMGQMANNYSRAQGRNLFNRLNEWRESGGGIAGTVSTSSLRLMDWASQPLYAGTNMQSYTPVSLDSVAAPGWSLFASGTGQLGDVASDGAGTGYDFNTGGMTLGADKKLGIVAGGEVVGGVYAGYAGSEAQIDGNGSKVQANGGKFGIYGSWLKEGLYANVQVGGGVSAYDTKRNVLGLQQKGETTGYEFSTDGAIGYEWKAGGFRFGPEGSLAYNYVGIDQFTESGGLAPLQIQYQNTNSLQSRLGGRLAYESNLGSGWWLRPGVDASWAHEFFNTANSVDARFASGAGGVFSGTPTRIGRDTAVAGANLTLGRGTGWNAWLGYEAEAGENLLVHTLNGGTTFRF